MAREMRRVMKGALGGFLSEQIGERGEMGAGSSARR
jgi:hypothetical protein